MKLTKRLFALSSLVLMLIGAFTFFFLRTTPEERLYQALSNFNQQDSRTAVVDMRVRLNEELHEKTIRGDASNRDSYDAFLDSSFIEAVSPTGKTITVDGVICDVLTVTYKKEKIAKPISSLIKQTSGAHGFGGNLFHEILSNVYLNRSDHSLVGFETVVDFPFHVGSFEVSSVMK